MKNLSLIKYLPGADVFVRNYLATMDVGISVENEGYSWLFLALRSRDREGLYCF